MTVASAQTLGTPQFTDMSLAGCSGSYIVSWTAVSGATFYEIWHELPGTTSYVLSKTSTDTTTEVHAPNLGGNRTFTFFEVAACDASGCGGFSNPIGLSWYSGCP
jgi:hypothetical protein